jgi:MerR family transcriptional regulator, heat shock protein HspR
MEKKYWSVIEIMEDLQVSEELLVTLEREEIICPELNECGSPKQFSFDELEKLRLARMLIEDMDVNIPGVEIILRMRQDMIHMRRQFDEILEDIAEEIKKTLEIRRLGSKENGKLGD